VLAITLNTEGEAKEVELVEGESQLDKLQEAVGGWVQAVDFTPNLTIWVNEEGKLIGLPINPMATFLWEKYFGLTDFICGNVIFTGGTGDEGETLGLNEETAKELRQFLRIN
jgi:hypothetical protein